MNQQLPPHQVEEVHLQDYINVIMRRRKTFLGAFLALFAAVALYTFLVQPSFESTATLFVKDDKGKVGQMGDLLLNAAAPVDSELEILKSRSNAEKVVASLHLDWQIDKRSKGVAVRTLEFASTAKEPVYHVQLLGGGSYIVKDDDGNTVGTGTSGVLMRGKDVTLLLKDLIGEKGDSFRITFLSFNETVESLRKQVKAGEIGKKTNVISITYRNRDPLLARDVVNTLVQAYLDQGIALKAEEATRTIGFVEDQLKGIKVELETAEKNLESYKSSSGVIQLDAEAQNLITTLSGVEKQKAEAALQRKQVEFALASLKDARKRGATYSPAIMRDDPLVAAMASRLGELEVQKRGLLSDSTESHPAVKSLQAQIDELQKKIQATYETSLKGLGKQEENISRNMSQYESQLKRLPVAERDLARLMRLTKVNADIYTFLLQKHEEARIAKASTISNIKIVDPAIPADKPVSPKKKKNLLLGLILGTIAGIGLAFFQEYLDDTIKDADEAKRLLRWPLLAIIPCMYRKREGGTDVDVALVCREDPKSVAAEAFRSLRTGIHFSSPNREKKLILVTSTFPGEGKSTVAANLAITLAHTGARVLILDCDLRRPTLHEKFVYSKTPGLTELLAGDAVPADILHDTSIANLDVISAGTTPPNPAELLGSEVLTAFLNGQRGKYDFIVIDAPPILAVTDATVLTSISDLVVVVIEAGRVPRRAAVRMREILDSTGAHVAGLVVNDKTGRAAAYGYYGGGYGYGYGYGYYGRDEEREQTNKKWWRRFF